MKIRFLMALAMSLVLTLVGSSAFAATGSGLSGTVTLGSTVTVSVTFSKNVTGAYFPAADGTAYSAGTYHSSGAREYGTSNLEGGMYWKDCGGGTDTAYDTPCGTHTQSITGSVTDFSGWAQQ